MQVTRPILIWSIIAAVCLIITWLVEGRRIALLSDRFITLRLRSLPADPLEYDFANLRIGAVSMPLIGTDNQRFNLSVQSDLQNRLVLSAVGQSFILGPRLSAPDPSGRTDIKFAAEPGDKVSFGLERSVISRPTPPFQINVLGGSTPSWRRYLYYRLEWKKTSGAKLDMLWRFEQEYYSRKGWNAGYMMYDFFTGLLRVKITSEVIPQEPVVVEYISRTKGWKRTDYRIESQGLTPDGLSDVLAVIHLQDLYSPSPGAGKSVVLHVNRATHQVTQELGGQ